MILLIEDYSIFDDYKQYLKGKTINDIKNLNMKPQELFNNAVKYNIYQLIPDLLKNKEVDPSANDNYAIARASFEGYLEIVKELLKDKRVNPSDNNNYAITKASSEGYLEIVKELLKDERVVNKLIPDLKNELNNKGIRF
jgi:hypothetical protein